MCAQFKNIVMPYPSLDPAIINGQHALKHKAHMDAGADTTQRELVKNSLDPTSNSANLPSRYDKSLLLFYHGGNHGECMAVRQALVQVMKGPDLMWGGNSSSQEGGEKQQKKQKSHLRLKYKTGYLNAVFCPVPVGDSPSSKRM